MSPVGAVREPPFSEAGENSSGGASLVVCNVENDSGLPYRKEAGRPPPNLPLVRGRDFQRYRFQCYSPLVSRCLTLFTKYDPASPGLRLTCHSRARGCPAPLGRAQRTRAKEAATRAF